MEDILASIRRILSEDKASSDEATSTEGEEQPETAPTAPAISDELDVLALDESMLVHVPAPATTPEGRQPVEWVPPPPEPPGNARLEMKPMPASEPQDPAPSAAETPRAGIVAPEAAAAAASSVGTLLRSLNVDRPPPLQVTRAGVTLEDMVREELRPMLKGWLDQHLPSLVERLVRAEIERVVGRAREE